MLVGGMIKYVERTAALFSASLDKFKDSMLQDPDPGANYAKFMEEYAAKRDMNMPTEVIVVADPEKEREGNTPARPNNDLTSLQVVQYAYKYFNIFRGLTVDLIFTNKQRDESRRFFDSLDPEEALSIIEVELNLIYDSLFTKAEILHNWTGVVFRLIALGCLVSSLCLFKMKKEDQYEEFDVALTYALLICGIALDSIALIMFCVSDWTLVRLRNLKEDLEGEDTWEDRILNWILGFRTIRWKRSQDGHEVLDRNFMFRRWSEYVHAYNLIGHCLKIPPKRIHYTKGMIYSFFQEITPCSGAGTRQFSNWIDRFLSNLTDQESAKSISSARGDWTLVETSSKRRPNHEKTEKGSDRAKLLKYVTEKDYDQSILMWHIATELLYQSQTDEEEVTNEQEYSNREFSKILSDYMMYLLIMQPTLMSAVSGIAKIRFRDTCKEANEFFKRRNINKSMHKKDNLVKEASRAILSVKTDIEPMDVKGDRSKSVLFDGSVLAKELVWLKTGGENMWEVVSKVWVELLCFAAIHCDSKEHASQLSKGGELINFVWLLMAHFGLGDQFQVNTDNATAKLIVAK